MKYIYHVKRYIKLAHFVSVIREVYVFCINYMERSCKRYMIVPKRNSDKLRHLSFLLM